MKADITLGLSDKKVVRNSKKQPTKKVTIWKKKFLFKFSMK